MDCLTVMAPMKTSLFADDPAATAIDFMVEKHMGLVPVIHRDGTFAGLISGDQMMGFLLPRALTTMAAGTRGLTRASYLNESATEMHERLEALREKTIGDLVDPDVDVVGPETPLIDALMMIKDRQYVVPVLDDERKLLGAISFFSVLYALREVYDRDEAAAAKARERAERERAKAERREVDE
ncbi:MAG: CBS domain-containing protein [Magnetovibrio sp.]|nr:CBS domain-containing protein [Magnetovibrio sp.]